jgi:hypothetical protein
MRILVTTHRRPDASAAGRWTTAAVAALRGAGCAVRLLFADGEAAAGPHEHVVRCGPAGELPFAPPDFTPAAGDGSFAGLDDGQVAAYREVLRSHLDQEVDRFNTHLVHCQHAWILSQLVMEAGVPYVVSVWGDELAAYEASARCRALADQAVENAGRLLFGSLAVRRAVPASWEVEAQRCQVLEADAPPSAESLLSIYRQLLVERFGSLPVDA